MNFKEELRIRTDYADNVIKEFLPEEEGFNKELCEAMNYSVNAGGKRLRPILLHTFYRLFGGDLDIVKPCMAAYEMLHTYSLVHDDLPAIDNDNYRRGMPTTHARFGEATAILAGDGLLHQAYETFIKIFDTEISTRTVKALKIFGDKTGINGMLGGQSADVLHTGEIISDELLYYIYEKKTGALIEGAMLTGSVLAGCNDEDLAKIKRAGELVGLAFQIKDDILDIYGNEKEIGKPLHSDEKNNKKTYITINGIEKSEHDIAVMSEEACDIVSSLGNDVEERDFIIKLIKYLTDRTY